VRFGVIVVAAAGNTGDRPYIASSPSVTPEVISVAQTQVPKCEALPARDQFTGGDRRPVSQHREHRLGAD